MMHYGWTLTEVKEQPYFQLLSILNEDDKKDKQKTKTKKEQEVIKGKDLIKLFGG
ncbi:hypothetical protein M4L90_03650 [Staphylococcus equorum]|uniref:Uncharacterized protein n=1 Tax=Staphylococcus equorum TaxID=246432 RepID=A0A9X4QWR0_9STAP|nr:MULTISPECIES: hypothetical protein [Staphylococcus]MDG0818987.1 hypothetical protein [Staphylococcus equorum]MDG0839628.1 hypothetical protein [Staphylococcus equorum]MDG0844646.1 hypothetical protein [Staphylococcus equorum]